MATESEVDEDFCPVRQSFLASGKCSSLLPAPASLATAFEKEEINFEAV